MNEEKTVERNEGCISQESKLGAYEELRLEGGEAGTNYRGPALRKGSPGPDSIAHVFIFIGSITLCPLYKLNLSTKVTLLLRVSLSDLV
jgi:hypothetical protein